MPYDAPRQPLLGRKTAPEQPSSPENRPFIGIRWTSDGRKQTLRLERYPRHITAIAL